MLALLLIAPLAHAEDAVTVQASVLSVLPSDYDGKRVHTTMSLAAPLTGHFCKKDLIPFMMGPLLVPGQAPAPLAGTWVLCVGHDDAATLAALPGFSPVEFEGNVKVKGPKSAPNVDISEVTIVHAAR
jgi:hypothetical protein